LAQSILFQGHRAVGGAGVLLVLCLAIGSGARANDADACEQETDPTLGVAACTRYIESLGTPGADEAWAFINRGIGHSDAGNWNQALADYTEAIRLDARNPSGYYHRAQALNDLAEYDRALDDIETAIGLDPTDADGYNVRGMIFTETGRYQKAADDFLTAVKLDREAKFHHNNFAVALTELGKCRGALVELDIALKIDRDYGNAIVNRGVALACLGEREQAMAEFNRALELYPGRASITNAIAWKLAKSDQPGFRGDPFPLRMAERTVDLEDTHYYRDTLAAALANAGRFDEAVAEQRRAMTMAREKGQLGFMPPYERHLALYERKQVLKE
jgi:tetratricopeptide (TPR) repeat protein